MNSGNGNRRSFRIAFALVIIAATNACVAHQTVRKDAAVEFTASPERADFQLETFDDGQLSGTTPGSLVIPYQVDVRTVHMGTWITAGTLAAASTMGLIANGANGTLSGPDGGAVVGVASIGLTSALIAVAVAWAQTGETVIPDSLPIVRANAPNYHYQKRMAAAENASTPPKQFKLLLPSDYSPSTNESLTGAREPVRPGTLIASPLSTPIEVVRAAPQSAAFALVIGIEHYREALPSPSGARGDAQRFADFLRMTLGLKSENIRLALDDRAARSDVERQLKWLTENVPAGSRICFYFSGHGSPAPTGGAYVLPYDADPSYLDETALPLSGILQSLARTKAKDVVAIVDSCFSGAGGRSVLPAGARPLISVKDTPVTEKVVLLSAAAPTEISGRLPGAEEGLFTHYLLEGLKTAAADSDGDHQIGAAELMRWVQPRVARDALTENRAQHPSMSPVEGPDYPLAWGLP